ncbi:IS200/IS605 family transposase [Clostridioides sp. ZZV15-6383]|uniref:IS200/IS605 family transposase n=1 Tax=unclassified Clostridioides TaxID=2635829 RepID=UPI001D109234|nr:IS200/IS605 family transposase [Clostridioides sp. ZZV14-6345]MCC0697988.1 IS200/IS605 family transposase [Clostridioides sp. ZZV15-6383]
MYKSNGNITYDCKYHIIFCPKYHKPVLVGEVEKMLKEIITYKADELEAEIIEMEIDKYHVHLVISCDPQFGIHKVVKGFSSRVLRENFKHCSKYIVSILGKVLIDNLSALE